MTHRVVPRLNQHVKLSYRIVSYRIVEPGLVLADT